MSEEKEAKKGFGEKLLNKLGFETVEEEDDDMLEEDLAGDDPALEEAADKNEIYTPPTPKKAEEPKIDYTAPKYEPKAAQSKKEDGQMEFESISGNTQKSGSYLNADNFSGVNAQVILIETEKIKDVMMISDELKSGKTVVINVEKLEKLDVIRLYDFLSGVTYVLGGKMKEISDNVIVVAPKNVEIKMTVSVPDEHPAASEAPMGEEIDLDF